MPEKETLEHARRDKAEGKAPSTQAGEFVREEMDHIREVKHGAKNTKQAIAIGLNKARSAGVDLKPPKKGKTSAKTRKSAESAYRKGHSKKKATSSRRSRAVENALKKMPKSAASKKALSKQAKSAAKRRSASSRSAAAKSRADESARTQSGLRKRCSPDIPVWGQCAAPENLTTPSLQRELDRECLNIRADMPLKFLS